MKSEFLTIYSVFGIRSSSHDTPHLTALYQIMDEWSKVMETGATPPVDIFPFLKLIPEWVFGNWIARSLSVGTKMDTLYGSMRARVEYRRQKGVQTNSFMDIVLDQREKLGLTDNQVNFLGGVAMEGGSDTTSTMILVFIQGMLVNHEAQKKAQVEIDTVCGEDRSPVWSDRENLPYVSMIVKETMRWRPVTPLAFPHALAQGKHFSYLIVSAKALRHTR